jgi:C4-dicarboxylate transporter DctM subunit
VIALALFGSFIIMLIINVPIGVALGLSSVLALMVDGLPLSMVSLNYYAASSKFVMLAIPFFILGGNILVKAGISTRIIALARSLVGHMHGGMGVVCVVSTCFFAAISGSAAATVAALGMIIIPAMIETGYGREDSSALMSVAGCMGLVIPPSILFVVFGSITGVSITRLFIAGVIPGLLMGASLLLACLIKNRKTPLTLLPKASAKERWKTFKDAIWGLLMPFIILGGIYGGVFTPTEAAVVAAVYGLFVAVFIYRSLTWKIMYEVLVDSSKQTAMVMFITAAASVFAVVITLNGYAAAASNLLIELSGGNLVVLLMIINVLLLVAGTVIDGASACLLFAPIVYPAAVKLGYDPIAVGVVVVMNLAISNATPPVAVCLAVGCSIGKVSLYDISKAALPYLAAVIITLILITYLPQIYMFLPNMM